MLKNAFILLLLQICCCYQFNMNQNREILTSLATLKPKLHVTFQTPVLIPGHAMGNNASCCVGTFAENLLKLLSNVTASGAEGVQLKKLKANLEGMREHKSNNSLCKMVAHGNGATWPTKYIKFLQKLNNQDSVKSC